MVTGHTIPVDGGWAALDDYRLHASHHTLVFILAANRHTEEVVR
jgi:hypothetical protein